jgi:hypothetical protein
MMSDKKPWTPGPWLLEGRTVYVLQPCPDWRKGLPEMVNRWFAGFCLLNQGAPPAEVEACALLASKSPEMIDILIRLLDGRCNRYVDTFHDLLLDAAKILREVGYQREDNS